MGVKEWKLEMVCDSLSLPARYEQIAEEAVEVAHAAMKRARVLRGENPTPRGNADTSAELVEELSDLRLCVMCVA